MATVLSLSISHLNDPHLEQELSKVLPSNLLRKIGRSLYNIVVPRILGFIFQVFIIHSQSRSKQSIHFKLWVTISNVMKSHAILVCPARDVNHPLPSYPHCYMLPTHWSLSSFLGYQICCLGISIIVLCSSSPIPLNN